MVTQLLDVLFHGDNLPLKVLLAGNQPCYFPLLGLDNVFELVFIFEARLVQILLKRLGFTKAHRVFPALMLLGDESLIAELFVFIFELLIEHFCILVFSNGGLSLLLQYGNLAAELVVFLDHQVIGESQTFNLLKELFISGHEFPIFAMEL